MIFWQVVNFFDFQDTMKMGISIYLSMECSRGSGRKGRGARGARHRRLIFHSQNQIWEEKFWFFTGIDLKVYCQCLQSKGHRTAHFSTYNLAFNLIFLSGSCILNPLLCSFTLLSSLTTEWRTFKVGREGEIFCDLRCSVTAKIQLLWKSPESLAYNGHLNLFWTWQKIQN